MENPETESVPKLTRVTVIGVWADGTSTVLDFREPDEIQTSTESDPLPDIRWDQADNPFRFTAGETPKTYFNIKVWPGNKEDSVIVIKSPIPDLCLTS